MNRNLLLSLCGLVGAIAMLATTGCNSPTPPPTDKQHVGAIGAIEGTISWFKGEFQPDLANIRGEIGITPVTVKVTPPQGPGTFGSTTVTPIPGMIHLDFGRPLESASRVTVSYTVSNLPVSIPIQLQVIPRLGGSFVRGNPQDAVCTMEQPTVSHFDFQFLPPPK